ncbi:MAG: YihA family ribosome biogenesis GTP-binding protein [Alphaproteobacteria bacterium]|nr:YihA family ribosome biogenesis GTP-binding protein [Alphaproteobacteria bacterium]
MSRPDPVLPVQTRQVRFIGSFGDNLPDATLPEIAFAGRSNVGKSSALNALVGSRGAARVSKTPGRTQALNLFAIDERVMFVDLPGYGYAKVPEAIQEKWKGFIEHYLGEREALSLVVCLVDGRHDAQPLDQALIAGLAEAGLPLVVVATKMDKVRRSARGRHRRQLAEVLGVPKTMVVPFSSHTNQGVAELWQIIDEAVRAEP